MMSQEMKELRQYKWRIIMGSLIKKDLTDNSYAGNMLNNGVIYGIDWNTGSSFMAGSGALIIEKSFEMNA